jgi:hypothetical protein
MLLSILIEAGDMMNKKGMATLETTVFIMLFTIASLAMYGYIKNAIQGNWKKNVDSFAEGQYRQGVTTETDSDVIYISPRIHLDLDIDGTVNENINVATASGIHQVPNWGRYNDPAEHPE